MPNDRVRSDLRKLGKFRILRCRQIERLEDKILSLLFDGPRSERVSDYYILNINKRSDKLRCEDRKKK